MKIKHKVVKEFQYLSEDKKIFVLKAGTIIEEYNYKAKSETIAIDSAIIENNPEFFEIVDWKADLLAYIKANKLPTPAVLTKKLIPFFEDIFASSASQAVPVAVDDSFAKDLDRRDKKIQEKEDEIEIRLNRLDKRESEYKEDMKSLDKREDSIRERSRELVEKSLDLDDKTQDLNERERNIDRSALESSEEIDAKYEKLQKKIDLDLKALLKREKELESRLKDISKKEESLFNSENKIYEKSKAYELVSEELEAIEPLIRNARLSISELIKLESLEGFVSDITKEHVNTEGVFLKRCLDEIEAILEKI
jgi:DNA repair exonuclease SbcCD ATPase subunit